MFNAESLAKTPTEALLHILQGACFLYAHTHLDETRKELEQITTEIIRRIDPAKEPNN